MACAHGRAAARLLRPSAPGTQPSAVCLECFFEGLGGAEVSDEGKVASVKELASIVLCSEARARGFAGRLLWRTPFLQRVAAVLAAWASAPVAPSAPAGEAPRLLADLAARCVADELSGGGAASLDARGGALGGAAAARSPQLLDAVVALVARPGGVRGSLLLLARLAECLDAGLRSALLDRLEASGPLLATLVGSAAAVDGAPAEAAIGLLLRLAERGAEPLGPHLLAGGAPLARSLARTEPGDPLATGLLALYSLCALHPRLLRSLLGSDPAATLQCIAEGACAHIASFAPALRRAACNLVESLAGALPGELLGSWLRASHLVDWLVEAVRAGDDFTARASAARVLGRLAGDEGLWLRLQGFASDALFEACADAVASVATGPLEARKDLLEAATGSLQLLLEKSCSAPLAPEAVAGLLAAARELQLSPGPAAAASHGLTCAACLLPVQLSVKARPLAAPDALTFERLLDVILQLLRSGEVSHDNLLAKTMCDLLVALGPGQMARLEDRMEPDADELSEGRVAQTTPNHVNSRWLDCACVLVESCLALPELVPALAAVLWPQLEAADFAPMPPVRAVLAESWWQKIHGLGHLVQPLLATARAGHGGLVAPDWETFGAHRVLAVLLAPSLCSATPGGPPLLLPVHELSVACGELLDGRPSWAARTAFAAVAVLRAAFLQDRRWDRAELTLLEGLLSSGVLVALSNRPVPLRFSVFMAAAAAHNLTAQCSGNDPGALHAIALALRHQVQLSFMASLKADNCAAEWQFLARPGALGATRSLALGLRWILAQGDECCVDCVMRGLLQFEVDPEPDGEAPTADGQPPTSPPTPSKQPPFAPIAALPSAAWIAEYAAPALARLPREELPSLLRLVWHSVWSDPGALPLLADRGARGSVVAAVARLWQADIAREACACFLMHFLAATPAVDAAAAGEVLAALEAGAALATEGGALALHVALIAFWRIDLPELEIIRVAECVHAQIGHCLESGLPELEEAAWAAIAASLLPVASQPLAQTVPAAAGAETAGVRQSPLAAPSCGQSAFMWFAALRHPSPQVQAFAAVALAAVCLGSVQGLSDDLAETLPNATDLQSLVSACASRAAASDGPPACRDAHCLALVALLSAPPYPQSLRAGLLRTAAEHLPPLLAAIAGRAGASDARAEDGASLASSPELLCLLLLLRGGACSTDPKPTQRLIPDVLPLARLAQDPAAQWHRRLLALRVLEAMFSLPLKLPPCQDVIVRQLVEAPTAWYTALGPSPAPAGPVGRLLGATGGGGINLVIGGASFLPRLLEALVDQLCEVTGRL